MSSIEVQLPSSVRLSHEAEVMVVGGGPGGLGAAVAAAREGADVLLVEHYGFLGGMATAGEINPFMHNHVNGESLDTGIFEEWLERMAHYGGVRPGSRVFDPNVARLAAEDLCLEAGVRLLFHHRPIHARIAGRRIDAVVLHSKGGLSAARARCYVDSTGDGDLAALAGCAMEFGSEESGRAQPMTLCFKLRLDPADLPDEVREQGAFAAVKQQMKLVNEVYHRAQAEGRIDWPREDVLIFPGVERDVIHFNTTRVVLKSGVDGRELSEAEVLARRQLRQIFAALRAEMPLFRNARIHSIAPQIGVRESRRLCGRARVTLADYDNHRRFPDAVARVNYPVDIHNPLGTGTKLVLLPKGAWYEIPWGALLPREIDNLAIGSRCISADHATHSSLRVMPPVCSIGQAAGTAAAMSIRQGIELPAVDGIALNRRLIECGRNLLPYDPTDAAPAPVAIPAEAPAAKARREAAVARAFSA